MEVAPTTEITFDLYGKLSKISGKFKELFNKGKAEEPQMAYAGAGQPNVQPQYQAQPNTQTDAPKPRFCGQCGAKNEANAGFCSECGAKL